MVNKTVTVAISGAFDPIHVGHIQHIRAAAKLGNKLVVILNTDDFLLQKRGFVFMPFEERKEIIENIKGVDLVVASIDKDHTVSKTLEKIKPDIFAKGGNWTEPGNIPEAATCAKIGCKLVTNVGGGTAATKSDPSWIFKSPVSTKETSLKINCPYCDDHPVIKEKCQFCHGKGKIFVDKQD